MLLTSDCRLFAPVSEQLRFPVPLSDISPSLIQAVVAVEDKRFFDHHGIDLRAILRAIYVNCRERRLAQGGSTLTQQLARMAVLRRFDRSVSRKILEAISAVLLERQLTKAQVLEAYLNASYFGHGVFGVELASLHYFHKRASDLDQWESAYLAGLLKAPARLCSCCNPSAAVRRTGQVLSLIGGSRVPEGLRPQPGRWVPRPSAISVLPATGHYAVDCVRKALVRHVPTRYPREGLVVRTTIDSHCQFAVERACTEVRAKGFNGRMAVVIQDAASGAIRGISGGSDFRHHPFNAAAAGTLQPGSVLKPFILLAALESGVDLDTRYDSRPLEVRLSPRRLWIVRNAAERYLGSISLADALVVSDNTVFARLLLSIGIGPVQRLLRLVGLPWKGLTPALSTGAIRPGVSPLQLCSAYSIFSNRGLFTSGQILSTVAGAGRRIWSAPSQPVQVCSEASSKQLTAVMRRVVTEGTGALPSLVGGIAAKTGSSISGSWYASYDDSYRVLTWTDADFGLVTSKRFSTKGVTARLLADRLWGLLRGPRLVFGETLGSFGGVDFMAPAELLWVERELRHE